MGTCRRPTSGGWRGVANPVEHNDGVTDRGIRKQLIDDGHVPVEGDARGPAADYLRDCLVTALGSTIRGGRAIMAWLQTTALRLAEAGQPFEWTTPSGSRVRQAYHALRERRVRTLCGRLQLADETPDGLLTPKKQALGAAPNFVHSFDASHLSLTVNACHDAGIRSFAMVHDSYGVHAANTTDLGVHLRDQFVAIYRRDWLGRLAEELGYTHGHVDIPPTPERGSLDIELVRDASFFFS